ncbi:MAG: hypothetical protein WAL98_06995 [Desulfatiglandaceae bacterium]|jgi:hypothetical protein
MSKHNAEKYIKHIYWLTGKEEEGLRRQLADRNINMKSAKGIVCHPLDPINKISSVAPAVWSDTCARQGSWYRNSTKSGLYLIISSFELDGYQARHAAILTASDFTPPRLATPEDKKVLIEDSLFREKMPEEWQHIGETEKRIYLRWARRLGSEVDDYGFLYLSHSANHANFLSPRFFVRDGEGMIPYSIDRSAHLCSCCVELFQILGGNYQKKMVAPCPGATIFARLKPDQYLLVERP